jgi:hypothetical protein
MIVRSTSSYNIDGGSLNFDVGLSSRQKCSASVAANCVGCPASGASANAAATLSFNGERRVSGPPEAVCSVCMVYLCVSVPRVLLVVTGLSKLAGGYVVLLLRKSDPLAQ